MRVRSDENPNMFEILRIGCIFKDAYLCDGWFYYCTESDNSIISCQLKHNASAYYMSMSTADAEYIETDVECEVEAGKFLEHLRNRFFKVVSRETIKEHPEHVYFDIDGKIVQLDHSMPRLKTIYEGANAFSMVWEGDVLWDDGNVNIQTT